MLHGHGSINVKRSPNQEIKNDQDDLGFFGGIPSVLFRYRPVPASDRIGKMELDKVHLV